MDVNEDTLAWRKARRSGENGGACIELAPLGSHVAVRDSKDPSGPKLLLTRQALRQALQVTSHQ